MVCWLRFLRTVSDMLKGVEPDLYRRKQLAISILKELEKEKGHDVDAIRKALEEEGLEGIVRRARRRKKKGGKEREKSEAVAEEAYS